MAGAPVLAASGALRSGAGLVTVGVPSSEVTAVERRLRPEAMCLGLPERQGTLDSSAAQTLETFIRKRKVTAWALGPGLSVNLALRSLVRKLMLWSFLPLVLDADGLNNAAGWAKWPSRKEGWPLIVTPHPGEMARLTGISVARLEEDRIGFATSFARQQNLVCVFKGHETIVTDGATCYVNTTGNPGMATGGSGDVLTGIMAGILAQKVRAFQGSASFEEKRQICLEAAATSVFLHGLSGDIAAREKGQMGLLALDIAEAMPQALRRVWG